MTEAWPSLVFAGLGAFHGLNPAMGWLFAVALGLHRQSRATVMVSLVPIAIGHAVSIAAVASLLILAGYIVPHHLVRVGSGLLLLGWGTYHWCYGHRHRVRFGMQVGLWGLGRDEEERRPVKKLFIVKMIPGTSGKPSAAMSPPE